MFNTFISRPAAAYPQTVNVTEKRAPTDDSVKLLREMQTAAEDKVIAAVRLDNNEFKLVIHKMDDVLSGQQKYRALFSINGRQMEADYVCCYDEHPEKTAIGLRDAVAKQIATAAIAAVLKKGQWL